MTDPDDLLRLSGDVRRDQHVRRDHPRAGARTPPSRTLTALVAVGALVVGFLVAVGGLAGRDVARAQDERRGELIELIGARQERLVSLERHAESLRRQISGHEQAGLNPVLRVNLDRAEQAAGMTGLRGPGLRVTFDEAQNCKSEDAQDCRIYDTDLQAAVNALFASGAEAVALNSERLIATSAIRGAGSAIMVNYRVQAPPYVLEAIGDPAQIETGFAESQVARNFSGWRESFGLGFAYEPAEDLVLDAYEGRPRLRVGSILEGSADEGEGT